MAKIFIDAYSDMLIEEAKANNIILAPNKIKAGRKTIKFYDYADLDYTIEEMRQLINEGKFKIIPLTMQDWLDFFTPYLDKGEDIVFFTISQKFMSDGGADLRSAFTKMSMDYPDNKCYLVDTNTVSRGTSEIALIASTIHKNEQDISSVIQYVNEKLIGTYVSAFVIDNLKAIQYSPVLKNVVQNFVGGSVGMKPIICIDNGGNLRILDSAKGFKSTVSKLYNVVADNGENIADYTFTVINFDAQADADKLYQQFANQVEINEIRNLTMGLNNAVILGGKSVGITFHSKQ
ncbi:MAG: DegV family protein [Clostridia bacterium]|nr:DegV family protein [Clostridia bacterium]